MCENSDRASRLRLATTFALSLMASASIATAQETLFADGFEQGTPIAWTSIVPFPPATAYLLTDLDLRDPHFFVPVPFLGCLDLTDTEIPSVTASLNQQIEAAITTDAGNDGWLDFSFLLLFRPLDTEAESLLDLRLGQCTAPLDSTTCEPSPMPGRLWVRSEPQNTGICLDTVPGSTSGYVPEIGVPSAPCFSALPVSTLLQINEIDVPLYGAQIAAGFAGDPPDALTTGLIKAFLRETDADELLIPADIPLIGGQPISTFLPGGAASCVALDDRDIFMNETGWWLYFNYEAELVPYTES